MLRVNRTIVGGCFFLLGCGEAGPEETFDATDPATSQEAIETAFDAAPSAAGVEVHNGANTALWVFACDSTNNLKRRIKPTPTSAWGSWTQIDANCASAPTVGTWTWNDGTEQIFVYIRGTGSHLRQLWYSSATATPVWTDLSTTTALGNISGAPRIVSYGANSSFKYVNLSAKNSQARLKVLHYDGVSWVIQPVNLLPDVSSGVVVTTNTVSTIGHWWDPNNGYTGWLAGRGISDHDDSTSWYAAVFPGSSGTSPDGWYLAEQFTGSSGTPTRGFNGSAFDVVARFGSNLKYKVIGSGSFSTIPSCSVDGSPQASDQDGTTGYVRGSTGALLRYNIATGSVGCTGLAGNIGSAPLHLTYNVNSHVFYKSGSNGHLMYWEFAAGHVDMGLTLL